MAAFNRIPLAPLPSEEVLGLSVNTERRTSTISYGLPFHQAAARQISRLPSAERVFIIASRTLASSTSALSELQSALGPLVVGTQIGMSSHTMWSECLSIAAEVRRLRANCILTLGGGSITDGAKFIATAALNKLDTLEAIDPFVVRAPPGIDRIMSKTMLPSLPLIIIPTTLSAGEHTPISGITTEDRTKYQVYTTPARLVIYDPSLVVSTPPKWWLSTGMRGVDHCVESLCALPEETRPEIDEVAEKGLKLLLPGLLKCKRDGQDLVARLDTQLGVSLAIQGILWGVPQGASHGIGHMLGPMGVGHGETSCVLMPAVSRYNEGVNGDRQARVRELLWETVGWGDVFTGRSLEREKATLADLLTVVVSELELPGRLSEVGVGEDRLEELAEKSLKDIWLKTNPRSVTEREQVLEILNMVK
ncbi:MAG: hypothetical protein MMC23_008709 [Stictis urceolatum]|nr:hypothetical protein [Stictis urceolata]